MDKRNIFILILSLICVATAFGFDFYDGTDGSGEGETSTVREDETTVPDDDSTDPTTTSDGSGDDETTVPPSTPPTTGPPRVEERVTMILLDAAENATTVVPDLQASVSQYVELYCADNIGQCVPSQLFMQTIESVAYGQATEEDTAMFLSVESRLFGMKKTHEIKESHHYRVMQDNITVQQVIITNDTVVGTDYIVEFYVRARYAGEGVIIPQGAVEETLVEYEDEIIEDIGFEFTILNPDDDGDGNPDEDDDEVLEPWAISLIVVAGVAVLGGIGYFIYKQNANKKRKKKSAAYLDDYTRVNTNTSNSNVYNNTPGQRTSYGSASSTSPSYKYDNPTYDKTDERIDKDDYQDVDLEAGPSEELRTSL